MLKSLFILRPALVLFIISMNGYGIFNNKAWSNLSPTLPKEIHLRTQYILDQVGAQSLNKNYPHAEILKKIPSTSQTEKGLKILLPYFDLNQTFSKYSTVTENGLTVYYDPQSRTEFNFDVSLSNQVLPIDNSWFKEFRELQLASTSEKPLQGFRIALDPGHMGGKLWDERTGKYVKDSRGRILSEGVMALQTALLLEKELIGLGADVLITHRGMEPVTTTSYEQLDIPYFAKRELQTKVLAPWFINIVNRLPISPSLLSSIQSDSEYKKLFNEISRWTYFFQREDLDARAHLINSYNPHLTLIIHYDTAGLPGNEHGLNPGLSNKTKAYVPGAFMDSELATSEDRTHFVYHVLNPVIWNASVELSHQLVSQLSQKLNIGYDPTGGSSSVKKVSEGVFARNLGLTRRLIGHPISYLECMFYNTPAEFERLYKNDFTVDIAGTPTPASNRILTVVLALKDGVLNFVKSYQPQN